MISFQNFLTEVITSKTPTEKVIQDFVRSKNKRFQGKSKKERIRMALGAKYAMMRGESVEHLTELSPRTLGSYIKKASNKMYDAGHEAGTAADGLRGREAGLEWEDAQKKADKRDAGITRATNKLVKHATKAMKENNELTEGLSALKAVAKSAAEEAHSKGMDRKQAEEHIGNNVDDAVSGTVKKGGSFTSARYHGSVAHEHGMKHYDRLVKKSSKTNISESVVAKHKVGDIIRVTEGPHANEKHKIIHIHSDGKHFNVVPSRTITKIKYGHGAATVHSKQIETEKEYQDRKAAEKKKMMKESVSPKYKVGDSVVPTMGPHQGEDHEITKVHPDNEHYNIKRKVDVRNGGVARSTKYSYGQATAHETQLKPSL